MLDELFNDLIEDEAFADTVFVEDALDALARTMEAKGISRAELARELGVSKAAVSKFFASVDPKMQTFSRYARAIGLIAKVELTHGQAASNTVWTPARAQHATARFEIAYTRLAA